MTDTTRLRGLTRTARGLPLVGLAGIAGVISYAHGLEVAHATGSSGPVAYLIPAVADLMIVSSSLALFDAAKHNERRPRLAALSLVVSIGATVAMNVAAGAAHGAGGALVSVLAPLAFVAAYEILLGMIRRARQRSGGEAPVGQGGPCSHTVPEDPHQAAVTWFLHHRDCLGLAGAEYTQRATCDRWPISREKLRQLVRDHDTPTLDPELMVGVDPPSGAGLNGHTKATPSEVTA